jgi:hypothetical protein
VCFRNLSVSYLSVFSNLLLLIATVVTNTQRVRSSTRNSYRYTEPYLDSWSLLIRIRNGFLNLFVICFNLRWALFYCHWFSRLSTDQMEDWTTAESALFEEAMEKYGKGKRQCHDNLSRGFIRIDYRYVMYKASCARNCIFLHLKR